MADERIITLSELLQDEVLVAVADAYVRSDSVSTEPPVWNTLAEQMAAIGKSYSQRDVEQAAWRALLPAKQFIAMWRVLNALPYEVAMGRKDT
jgi:hypothetical protein